MTATAFKPQGPPGEDPTPSPWTVPPVLEGPTPAPRRLDPLQEAHTAAVLQQNHRRELDLRRRRAAEARRDHAEAIRRAEVQHMRNRLRRVEDRRERAEPLLRDGVLGGLAVATPLLLATTSAGVPQGLRRAASAVSVLAALVAGREWMNHQHERRVQKLDDERERLQGRLAIQSIPQPWLDHQE